MPGRWGKMPFAALLPCLVLGLGGAHLLTHYSFAALALADLLLLCAGWLSLRSGRLSLSLATSLAALILGGLLSGLVNRDSFSPHSIRSLLARGALPLDEALVFDGCLAEETEKRDDEILLTVAMHGFRAKGDWIRCEGSILLRMPAGTTEEIMRPRYG